MTRLKACAARAEDLKAALRLRLRDIAGRPALSLFFGLVYALFSDLLIAGLMGAGQVWTLIAVGVGFPLVAPFLAAGLYEMSRRLQRAEPSNARDILLVVFNQQRREFCWMALVVLFFFWMWAYQVRLWLAIFLQNQPTQSFESVVAVVFSTFEGAMCLAIGSGAGAVLATGLFSITGIAMPLLLDKDVDFVTAMLTSIKAVR